MLELDENSEPYRLTMSFYYDIINKGGQFILTEGKFNVRPRELVTDKVIAFIKEHRNAVYNFALMQKVSAEIHDRKDYCVICGKQACNYDIEGKWKCEEHGT